jgi:outer membrane protein assembly factor BamB
MNKIKTFLYLTVFLLAAGQINSQQRVNVESMPVSASPMWETPIDDTIRGTPHLQAGSAVLVGEGGSVRAFYMSGTPLWNFDARGTAVPHISRSYEAATYICNTDGVFMAINRVGRELWRINLERPISYPPVVGWDGRVFIFLDSVITCRTASGNSLWTLDLGSPIAFAPILDRTGSIAAVLQNMDFVRVNQFSYLERIRLERIPSLIVSLIEGESMSYVLMYQGGEMEKIFFDDSAPEGSKLSRANLSSLPAAPVAAASRGAQFVVTLRNGRTLCLDAQGNILWTRNSHEASEERGSGNLSLAQAKMIWDERGIYAITIRGVSAFTDEGRRRFVFRLSTESSGVPAFSDEGLLYAS